MFFVFCRLGFKKEEQLKQHSKSKDNCSQQKNKAVLGFDCPTQCIPKTLPKAQRTRGLSSAYQSDLFWSYISKVQTQILIRILTKHQLQNLNQTSASRLSLKFIILIKPRFRISTKIQPPNLYITSAAKY